jgi:hypothetical protein
MQGGLAKMQDKTVKIAKNAGWACKKPQTHKNAHSGRKGRIKRKNANKNEGNC